MFIEPSYIPTMHCDNIVPSGAPRNLQVSAVTENSIQITWDEIECLEQNGLSIAYRIRLNGGDSFERQDTQFTLINLSPQTAYTIEVSGFNAAGTGPPISIVGQTTAAAISDILS